MIEGFVKFLIATAKTHSEEEAILLIEEKMKKVINSEINDCIQFVKAKQDEWGDTAVCVKFITRDLLKSMEEKKF